jgi:ribosomal protein S18 acetylase RimI-like enzyme
MGFGPLWEVLDRLADLDVRLGGGWGVDVLAGRVTRAHHDVDVFVPIDDVAAAAARFTGDGLPVVSDEAPSRVVLGREGALRVDLNGLVYRSNGDAVQLGTEGDIEVFPSWAWTEQQMEGRRVVCLTAEAQRLKHRGYRGRPVDGPDVEAIAHIDEPPRFDPSVRPLEPDDAELLEGIEITSGALFAEAGLTPFPPDPPELVAARAARTARTLVAGRPAVAFCRLEVVDGHGHVGQISVLPECGRLGLGTSLMRAAVEWSGTRPDPTLTLTTFADVPWNAPWYERLGFRELEPPFGPELTALVAAEAFLERWGRRVVMVTTGVP